MLPHSVISNTPSLSSSMSKLLIIPSPSKSSFGPVPPIVCENANKLKN